MGSKLKPRVPLYVDLLVTKKCNFDCSFCSATKSHPDGSNEELSVQEFDKLFAELDSLGVLKVGIEGGEPFLRQDIFDILKLMDKYMFEYYINTNGSMITPQVAARLKETDILKVCLSIDGHCSEVHDTSRGFPGAFHLVNQAIDALNSYDIPIDGVITLSRINYKYLFETLDFCASKGIKKVAVMLLATVGNAAVNKDQLLVPFDEWAKLLREVTDRREAGRLPVGLRIVTTGESLFPWEMALPFVEGGEKEKLGVWIKPGSIESMEESGVGCTAGRSSLAIDSYGNVFGCGLTVAIPGLRAGNVREQPLKRIWEESPLFNHLRSLRWVDLDGPCSTCEYLAICKGGCRGSAFAITGKTNGSDMRCPLAK